MDKALIEQERLAYINNAPESKALGVLLDMINVYKKTTTNKSEFAYEEGYHDGRRRSARK